MPWILLHQTWQIYLPVNQCLACLEYWYTKLGISTPTPSLLRIDALNYCYTKFGRSTPINGAYMPWILLHQTWQIYPHQWSIDALNTAIPNLVDLLADLTTHQSRYRYLEYWYTKLGRSTPHQLSIDSLNIAIPNLADLLADLPPSMEHRCLEYWYTKLGLSTTQSIKCRCLG